MKANNFKPGTQLYKNHMVHPWLSGTKPLEFRKPLASLYFSLKPQLKWKYIPCGWSSQGSNTDHSPCFLNRVQVLSCWDFEQDLSDTRVHSWTEFYSCAVRIEGEWRKALCNAGLWHSVMLFLWKSTGFTEEETLMWQMKQHCEHYC